MVIKKHSYLFFALFCVSIFPVQHAPGQEIIAPTQEWWTNLQKKAAKAGVTPETVKRSLDSVEWPVPEIIKRDRNQAENIEGFWRYTQRRVDKERIESGKRMLKRHKALFDTVEARTGVPSAILVAFWGLETNYGEFTGNFNAISATATLSLDSRRSKFFQKELVAALVMVQRGYLEPENMVSSWAGAMGHMQFLPSTTLAYAIDGDGDQKINLHHSLEDAVFSAGNFLKKLGWRKDIPCFYEVIVPDKFDYTKSGFQKKETQLFWQKNNVKAAYIQEKDAQNRKGEKLSLIIPAGSEGPSFLSYSNFNRVLNWNRSINYALSVCYLARQIEGKAPFYKSPPDRLEPSLSIEDIRKTQTFLRKAGYKIGTNDGIFGSKTRRALQAWQKKNNIPADGHLNKKILDQLQKEGR